MLETLNNNFEIQSVVEEVQIVERLSSSYSGVNVYLILDSTDNDSGIRSFQKFTIVDPFMETLDYYRQLGGKKVLVSGKFIVDDSFESKVEFKVRQIVIKE